MTEENKMVRLYRPSFNTIRIICMMLIVVIEFGLNFIPYFSFITPFLYFSQGTLFTIYGYIVLRDGADLGKNIKHTFKVFFIMLLFYGLFSAGFCYIFAVNPLSLLTKRNIFNFFVLNLWPLSIGASIWYIQATLYSLIAFWIFRKLKKYDWVFCIILFVAAILVGEFAGLIHFNVLGYSYISGNFLTRAMPYMLLGRIIHNYYDKISSRLRFGPFFYFLVGLLLSLAEFLALGLTGNLVYEHHFIGFILMSAALCIWCVCEPAGGILYLPSRYSKAIYKGMFFTFNPLGYMILIIAGFLCKTTQQISIVEYSVTIIVLVLTFFISWLAAFLKEKSKHNNKLQDGDVDDEA